MITEAGGVASSVVDERSDRVYLAFFLHVFCLLSRSKSRLELRGCRAVPYQKYSVSQWKRAKSNVGYFGEKSGVNRVRERVANTKPT